MKRERDKHNPQDRSHLQVGQKQIFIFAWIDKCKVIYVDWTVVFELIENVALHSQLSKKQTPPSSKKSCDEQNKQFFINL